MILKLSLQGCKQLKRIEKKIFKICRHSRRGFTWKQVLRCEVNHLIRFYLGRLSLFLYRGGSDTVRFQLQYQQKPTFVKVTGIETESWLGENGNSFPDADNSHWNDNNWNNQNSGNKLADN